MTKPAGKIVSLAELRFKPANSNDAARAVVAHQFAEVPDCAFARDDGISPYLGSETGMEAFPGAPDATVPENADVPAIQSEAPEANGSLRRKLMRGGFALSMFLHAALAVGVGLATLSMPDDAPLEEGITSVTLVTQGTSEVNANLAGDKEAIEKPVEKPVDTPTKEVEKPVEAVEKPIVKPLAEEKPVEVKVKPVEKPIETKTAEVPAKDAPIPGADLPEILTSHDGKTETEAVEKPRPVEKKVELQDKPATPVTVEKPLEAKPVEQPVSEKQPIEKPIVKKVEPAVEMPAVQAVTEKPVEQKTVEKQPEEKPKPVEKKVEDRKEPPKKEEPKKEKPHQKRQQNLGNQGNTSTFGTKGDVDAKDKGRASTSSKGASKNRDIGNASETNYKGLVSRKLSRAKGRMPSPAKGKLWVTFTILSDGSISGLSVTKSSGKPAVDAIALRIVRAASPFPAIPSDAGRKSWKMTVPMTFKGG